MYVCMCVSVCLCVGVCLFLCLGVCLCVSLSLYPPTQLENERLQVKARDRECVKRGAERARDDEGAGAGGEAEGGGGGGGGGGCGKKDGGEVAVAAALGKLAVDEYFWAVD